MKSFVLLSLAILPGVLFAQNRPQSDAQQNFAAGGTIRLHLESGGYTIRPTENENIVVKCSARSEESLKDVKAEIRVAGTVANVYVRNTPEGNFSAVIEVPRRSNLWARLTAGEMNVGNIEGDKDLEIRAGQLSVAVPRPEVYGSRDASVWTGAIEAPAFEISKGGMFRSFHQQGPGKYRLYAHVMAGEIDLRGMI